MRRREVKENGRVRRIGAALRVRIGSSVDVISKPLEGRGPEVSSEVPKTKEPFERVGDLKCPVGKLNTEHYSHVMPVR